MHVAHVPVHSHNDIYMLRVSSLTGQMRVRMYIYIYIYICHQLTHRVSCHQQRLATALTQVLGQLQVPSIAGCVEASMAGLHTQA